jgi:hypothetical protein
MRLYYVRDANDLEKLNCWRFEPQPPDAVMKAFMGASIGLPYDVRLNFIKTDAGYDIICNDDGAVFHAILVKA